jgi:hypothetical protein
MFNSKRDNIIESISNFKEIIFNINEIADNVYEIINEDKIFYIIFESENIFTTTSQLLSFKIRLSDIEFKSNNILRIPYFAGCSGYDLGYFLLGKNTSISMAIDYKIDYNLLPVDFNYYGFERYLNYMLTLVNGYPVFNSNNNIEQHYNFFIQERRKLEGKINLLIPLNIIRCFKGKDSFLSKLIELLKKDDDINEQALERYIEAD